MATKAFPRFKDTRYGACCAGQSSCITRAGTRTKSLPHGERLNIEEPGRNHRFLVCGCYRRRARVYLPQMNHRLVKDDSWSSVGSTGSFNGI